MMQVRLDGIDDRRVAGRKMQGFGDEERNEPGLGNGRQRNVGDAIRELGLQV